MNIWATFADNEIYLKSAYALALSLQQVKSKYNLLIMVPINIDNKLLNTFMEYTSSLNIIIKKVPYLYFNFLEQYKQNITINKFHLFSLIEYKKICFIDADSFFIENIDSIFNLDTPAIGYYYNDKNEQCFSGGIFLIQPSLSFYSLILNLCIAFEFYDDDNLFYYLAKENNILKFKNFFNDTFPNYKNIILQEQKPIKFWNKYNYNDIKKLANTDTLLEQLKEYVFN